MNISRRTAVAAALATAAVVTPPALAEPLLGLTTNNRLIAFDSASPGSITTSVAISGLRGDSLVAIDRRPADGGLYGLSDTSRVYSIDPISGAATPVGNAGAFALAGASFGFDFNPVVDRIRVTSDADQNLRLNPNDGTLTATDGALAYAAGDRNAAANPNVVGSAYANNFAPSPRTAPGTTLFGIDSRLDLLVTQNPPNAGTLNTVGALGINVPDRLGFDISGGTGLAYLAFGSATDPGSLLYGVDLTTGAASPLGRIGGALTVTGLAAPVGAAAVPEPATALLLALGAAGLFATGRRR